MEAPSSSGALEARALSSLLHRITGQLSWDICRLGAACIVVVMLGAIFLVHLPNGFDIGKGGAEYALTQLLLAVAFLLAGPGSYSLAFWLPAPLRKF